MLYTCQHLCDGQVSESPGPYKIAHKNHPMTKWVRESYANYKFTHNLALELLKEFEYRYGHGHKCSTHLEWLAHPPPGIPRGRGFTPVPPCMPDEYKVPGDPVESLQELIHRWKEGNS